MSEMNICKSVYKYENIYYRLKRFQTSRCLQCRLAPQASLRTVSPPPSEYSGRSQYEPEGVHIVHGRQHVTELLDLFRSDFLCFNRGILTV